VNKVKFSLHTSRKSLNRVRACFGGKEIFREIYEIGKLTRGRQAVPCRGHNLHIFEKLLFFIFQEN
jgi:hypothetical protein